MTVYYENQIVIFYNCGMFVISVNRRKTMGMPKVYYCLQQRAVQVLLHQVTRNLTKHQKTNGDPVKQIQFLVLLLTAVEHNGTLRITKMSLKMAHLCLS